MEVNSPGKSSVRKGGRTVIETKVPMDIRSYKAKLMGPFTVRQLVCGVIAALIDAVLFLGVLRPLGIGLKTSIILLVLVDVPIMSFTMEPHGMPMEVYIRRVLLRSFLAPSKRLAVSSLPRPKQLEYTKKEIRKSKKRVKQLSRKQPNFKAYK